MRPNVQALDEILGNTADVLDYGFVRVIDYMGNDSAIVQAARVSHGHGAVSPSSDTTLIRYLMRHRHTTPFEMCEIKFHMKMPIFVARQFIRHRTASVNEISGRYSVLDGEFYIPSADQLATQSKANRQGRADILSDTDAATVMKLLDVDATNAHYRYGMFLEKFDLSRELARINLPLSTYTSWYWKTDLHNLLNFLALRLDGHAQYEIRVYGEAMAQVAKVWCPIAWQAFLDYRYGAVTFSAQAMDVLRRMVCGLVVSRQDTTLGEREWADLMAAVRPAVRKPPREYKRYSKSGISLSSASARRR
jgi:thymidylate synthase (FAD)